MSKDYEWELLHRIAAALEMNPALFFGDPPPPARMDGDGAPPSNGAAAPPIERKRLLDSLRLHKAFEAIQDEDARLEALRAVEAICRRQSEGRAEPVLGGRAADGPDPD
ncbi:hypothetical protein J2X36_004667 [Methylobacterium sp. BE186]|uniref:hypothetical protein n=1 Tax=Methylobacterium sp. BE186 TaxID=2817715 RepID=UPI00285B42DD|nr:hypothetical protein [Methylobacterium sp. BE186]MDR7039889.1 hypothetical protein [Methylobacterium sp. BE186]